MSPCQRCDDCGHWITRNAEGRVCGITPRKPGQSYAAFSGPIPRPSVSGAVGVVKETLRITGTLFSYVTLRR